MHWSHNKFQFLKSHIRRKDLSKSSRFNALERGVSATSSTTTHDVSQRSTDTNSIEKRIRSDSIHQPPIATTVRMSAVLQPSSVDQQILEQFSKMTTVLTPWANIREHQNSFLQLPDKSRKPGGNRLSNF